MEIKGKKEELMEIKGGKGGIDGDIQRDGGREIEIEVERLR